MYERDDVAEKKCSECTKMRKRTDFAKDEWKKEDGNSRSCWSCSNSSSTAETKTCSKCSGDKERSFFAKADWTKDEASCMCNDCKNEKPVKKVKAVKDVKTKENVVKKKKLTK